MLFLSAAENTSSFVCVANLGTVLKYKYPNFEVGLKCILMVLPYNGATVYAIVNDRFSVLELAITQEMGVPPLNDLAVDGTLNTTNQPNQIWVMMGGQMTSR